MSTQLVADEFLAAFKARNIEACKACLTEDFLFTGAMPDPVNADRWMGTIMGMQAAFPDINYNIEVTKVDGDKIHTTTQLAGTHTGDWDLSIMGMGVIPATGKSFSNPKESGVMTVKNGKIATYNIETSKEGGLVGMFAQLGIPMPA